VDEYLPDHKERELEYEITQKTDNIVLMLSVVRNFHHEIENLDKPRLNELYKQYFAKYNKMIEMKDKLEQINHMVKCSGKPNAREFNKCFLDKIEEDINWVVSKIDNFNNKNDEKIVQGSQNYKSVLENLVLVLKIHKIILKNDDDVEDEKYADENINNLYTKISNILYIVLYDNMDDYQNIESIDIDEYLYRLKGYMIDYGCILYKSYNRVDEFYYDCSPERIREYLCKINMLLDSLELSSI
jgi:hypothetical protein